MTIETNKPNYYRTTKTYARVLANRFSQCRVWIRCPRCIGGNMYQERNGKYVCVQCGCTYHSGMVTKPANVAKEG
jgi:uncharacterized protein (DUF983 family)